MYRALLLLTLLALVGADTPAPGGTITGAVITLKDNKRVARTDVYVYLEEVKRRRSRTLPGEGIKRQIRQEHQAFVPSLLVVPVGAEVAFPNFDREEHNVYSPTDPGFDLGKYGQDKRGKTWKFEDPDEFDIFCDIHRKMWAKVKVVDSPYIQPVTSGVFAFTNVPPGTYRVVAWVQNSVEVRSEPVTITSGGSIKLPAELRLQPIERSGCHDRRDGTPYDKYSTCPSAR